MPYHTSQRDPGSGAPGRRRGRRPTVPAAGVALWALGAVAPPLSGQELAAPLRIGERNPLLDLSYTVRTEGADPVGAGRLAVGLGHSYSNIFEFGLRPGAELRIDMERLVSEVVVRYGVSERVELGGRWALRTDWGGFLDPVISGVHRLFGLPDGDRDRVAEGEVAFQVESGDSVAVRVPGASLDSEDLRIFGKVRLAGGEDAPFAVSARGAVKLPTGSERVGTGGTDVAMALLGRATWGDWRTYGHLGVVRFSSPDALAAFARDAALTGGFGVERPLGSRWSVLAHLLGSTSYYGGFDEVELDRPPLNLGIGAVVRPGGGWRFEVSFTEDLPGDNPAVDFGIDVHVTRVF